MLHACWLLNRHCECNTLKKHSCRIVIIFFFLQIPGSWWQYCWQKCAKCTSSIAYFWILSLSQLILGQRWCTWWVENIHYIYRQTTLHKHIYNFRQFQDIISYSIEFIYHICTSLGCKPCKTLKEREKNSWLQILKLLQINSLTQYLAIPWQAQCLAPASYYLYMLSSTRGKSNYLCKRLLSLVLFFRLLIG